MCYNKLDVDEFLREGISEARLSDEYTVSTKKGCKAGFGDDPRKCQLKNLQSGTEKIVKALFLKHGYSINKIKKGKCHGLHFLNDPNVVFDSGLTHALGYLIQYIQTIEPRIDNNNIITLREINKANDIKHGIKYQTKEIPDVRDTLNKLDEFVREKHTASQP